MKSRVPGSDTDSGKTTANTSIRFNLPAGIHFIDDGTAKIAMANSSGNMTASAAGFGEAQVVFTDGGDINGVKPSFVIPGSAIPGGTGGAFQSGEKPVITFGTLSNPDNDPGNEYMVIEFNGLVTNEAANQAGTSLTAAFNLIAGGTTLVTSNSSSLSVAEPVIGDLLRLVRERYLPDYVQQYRVQPGLQYKPHRCLGR